MPGNYRFSGLLPNLTIAFKDIIVPWPNGLLLGQLAPSVLTKNDSSILQSKLLNIVLARPHLIR